MTNVSPGTWAPAVSIDEVLDRMAGISESLPSEDGVATFNRMYSEVTRLVRAAVVAEEFANAEFLERLDVHFANLFFDAYAADRSGMPVSAAWEPLFESRLKPNTHPIQFALAGMNAHISHDLPHAVVTTCREMALIPDDGTPEHGDFRRTNDVLDAATPEIKGWFVNGLVARLDELGGRLDDGFAMFGIHVAREAAWECSEMLWRLQDDPRLDGLYRSALARGVQLTSRGILL